MSEDVRRLFQRFVRVWESGDMAQLDNLIAPGYRGHPASGERDAAGLRARILAFRQAFLEPRFTLHDQLVEGDKVASRLTCQARRASDGQPVLLYGHNISRVEGGRIAEEWMAWEAAPYPTQGSE